MISRRHALCLLSSPLLAGLAAPALAAGRVIAAPITLNDKRILLDVAIGGQGPYPFVIDSGGALSLIRESLAQELNLKRVRTIQLNGKSSPIYAAKDVVLGGALRQPDVMFGGVDGARLGGQGSLASGLLTAGDCELDLDAGQWRLFPDSPPDRTAYTRLKAVLRQESQGATKRIFADVMLDGEPIEALLDTGWPHALCLSHEQGVARGLWNDTTPFAPIQLSNGVTGAAPNPGRLVRVKRLELGPIVLEQALVAIRPEGKRGGGAIAGLPFLRMMNWSLSTEALWVRRNAQAATFNSYGRSGLWVAEQRGAVRVEVVGAGGPAAKAGVRPGDVIEGGRDLQATLALLDGPVGQPIALTLKRGGETVRAEFAPADYL